MTRELTPAERKVLKAAAHALNPVVLIGAGGLTPAVLKEIDAALLAHELIKVRAATDDREERQALLAQIASQLDCAPVQHIGKMLVFHRVAPESDAKSARRQRGAARPSAGEIKTPAKKPRANSTAKPAPRKIAKPKFGQPPAGQPATPKPAPRTTGKRGASRIAQPASKRPAIPAIRGRKRAAQT